MATVLAKATTDGNDANERRLICLIGGTCWCQLGDAELLVACALQGSSPAVDELAAKESGGDEAQGAVVQAGTGPPAGPPGEGPPEGAQVGRNIAHYRPYFSVYVPRTAARAIRPRGASDEAQRPRNCASLPSDGLLGAHALLCLKSLAGELSQISPDRHCLR